MTNKRSARICKDLQGSGRIHNVLHVSLYAWHVICIHLLFEHGHTLAVLQVIAQCPGGPHYFFENFGFLGLRVAALAHQDAFAMLKVFLWQLYTRKRPKRSDFMA